ncbi:hypothetical protein vseg_010370 [Gypsophila vaccaria]
MDNKFFMDSNVPHQLQYDHPFSSDYFDSELSSMVSSPTSNSAISTDNFMIRELIGKIGNIHNTNNQPNYTNNSNCSTNNSCYTTPSNSPPKYGKSTPNVDQQNFPNLETLIDLRPNLPAMPGGPGFAERAARFSSFGSKSFNGRPSSNRIESNNVETNGGLDGVHGKLHRVCSTPVLKVEARPKVENDVEFEKNSTSTRNHVKENGSSRKRKTSCDKVDQINENESNGKRSKDDVSKEEENKGGDDEELKRNDKSSEPFKDYIHVRARRGQATDSHSLAERVRREKIGERMKLLQDLVPGCNKVTGKALMLEEIINYVQSLQRQVEFLSMKLSNVNSPRQEMNMCNFSKDSGNEPNCSMEHPMYQTMVPTLYGQPQQNALQDIIQYSMDPFNSPLNHNNHSLHSPLIDGFSNYLSQLPSLCEGDLQSIVHMGFSQKGNGYQSQPLHGTNSSQMKIEF